jgi:hypothetical protein
MHLEQETPSIFFYELLNARKKKPHNELHTRTNFQCFVNEALRSAFKKLIVSMPTLLRGLHTMSLAKSVPEQWTEVTQMQAHQAT